MINRIWSRLVKTEGLHLDIFPISKAHALILSLHSLKRCPGFGHPIMHAILISCRDTLNPPVSDSQDACTRTRSIFI